MQDRRICKKIKRKGPRFSTQGNLERAWDREREWRGFSDLRGAKIGVGDDSSVLPLLSLTHHPRPGFHPPLLLSSGTLFSSGISPPKSELRTRALRIEPEQQLKEKTKRVQEANLIRTDTCHSSASLYYYSPSVFLNNLFIYQLCNPQGKEGCEQGHAGAIPWSWIVKGENARREGR